MQPEAKENRILVGFLRAPIEKALERGVALEPLLQRHGLTLQHIWLPHAHIEAATYTSIIVELIRLMNDEWLGFSPRPQRPGTWVMICRAVIECGLLQHALARMFKYYGLFDDNLRCHLRVEGDEAVISVTPPRDDFDYRLFTYEQALSTSHRFACWLIDDEIPIRSLSFMHAAPEHHGDYASRFQARRVSFGQPHCELRFSARYLDARVRQNDRTLQPLVADPGPELLLPGTDHTSWTTRLRKLVCEDLTAVPDFESLSARLGIHPQKLRRHLAAEGITYTEIKDEVRRQAAIYYVTQQSMSIEEMAYRSGFSEASALIRAFKRWTGTTPLAYAHRCRHDSDHVVKAA